MYMLNFDDVVVWASSHRYVLTYPLSSLPAGEAVGLGPTPPVAASID